MFSSSFRGFSKSPRFYEATDSWRSLSKNEFPNQIHYHPSPSQAFLKFFNDPYFIKASSKKFSTADNPIFRIELSARVLSIFEAAN